MATLACGAWLSRRNKEWHIPSDVHARPRGVHASQGKGRAGRGRTISHLIQTALTAMQKMTSPGSAGTPTNKFAPAREDYGRLRTHAM